MSSLCRYWLGKDEKYNNSKDYTKENEASEKIEEVRFIFKDIFHICMSLQAV